MARLSLEDLFSLVDESNRSAFRWAVPEKVSAGDEDYLQRQLATGDSRHMILALHGLGKLGTTQAFDAVKAYIEGSTNADRKILWHADSAIEEMPGSLTLETARQWFRRPEHHLQYAAGDILGKHAVPEDVPLLTEALHTPETLRGEDPRLSGVLEALTRFEGFGRIPELEHVFCQVENSFWRYLAARAMATTTPGEFARQYALECLWDCQEDTRALGCRMADLSMPCALERIREIATDGNDYEDVQQAAVKRLEESML